jgi:hypothetical protein
MHSAKPKYRELIEGAVLSPLFYQDDQILCFPALHDARKWLHKYVRGKRGKRGKSVSISRGRPGVLLCRLEIRTMPLGKPSHPSWSGTYPILE